MIYTTHAKYGHILLIASLSWFRLMRLKLYLPNASHFYALKENVSWKE